MAGSCFVAGVGWQSHILRRTTFLFVLSRNNRVVERQSSDAGREASGRGGGCQFHIVTDDRLIGFHPAHGEMLGADGMWGTGVMWEAAVPVLLAFHLPG
jgi:hypothetical protein